MKIKQNLYILNQENLNVNLHILVIKISIFQNEGGVFLVFSAIHVIVKILEKLK